MKKTLILSLALAVVLGITGCSKNENEPKVVEKEKPVMILDKALDSVKDAGNAVVDGVENAAEKAGDAISETAKNAKEGIENAAESVVETGEDTMDKAEEVLDESTK